jgi:hypothetical protein
MSVISALADTVSRKPNPRKYPANRPLKAPLVRAKLDTTLAELEKLKSRHPDAALRATLGEDGGAEAFHELRDQIAEQEQIVAVLTSALGAAEADDNTLRQQQIAALRANEIVEVKRLLDKRDAAAQTFAVAVENAVAAYRAMVEAGLKAGDRAGRLLNDRQAAIGMRVERQELYQAAALELHRQSVEWPIRPGNELIPVFPYDRSVTVGGTVYDRGDLKPLADDLRQRSSDLVAVLKGKQE